MSEQYDDTNQKVALEQGVYSDIRVVRKRTNQSGFLSGAVRKLKHHEWTQTRKNHIVKRGNSYGGRPEGGHHTRSHNWKSSVAVPTQRGKFNSTLRTGFSTRGTKGNPPVSRRMESQPQQEEKGVTGLLNMRNTCYMNSALQALRHNTELSAFFLENKHQQWVDRKPGSPKVELVKGYADLLRSLWSGSKPAYVRPEGFLQCMHPAALQAGFDQFTIPMQHDSHEFLTFLLDQLHEGMAEEVNIEITRPPPQNPREKAIFSALEAWKRSFGKNYSPLTEMIYGLMRVSLTCTKCNNCVDNWETFNCLKVPIPATYDLSGGKPTLNQMLSDEFKEETIEGYACEKCSPHRPSVIRKCSIWRLPRMLCLSVKRFTPDGRKIHTPLQFSVNDQIQFSQYFTEDSPEPSKSQVYECFGSVDHHGVAGGGHYTAQAKSPLTEKWHLFDDETAYPLTEPQFGESTYILFFKPSSKAPEA
jgi:ubiquitin carboxyl-terminal hydrolase 8